VVGGFIRRAIIILLILSATYGAVILALALLLRRLRVSGRRAISVSFLVFGGVTGVLAAWAWPLDSSVYPNVWATLLGDWIYHVSTLYLGAPWPLQVPQVYIVASTVLCGVTGLSLQWLYNRRAAGESASGSVSGEDT